MAKPNTKRLHRESLRKQFWPNEIAWTGEDRKGFFQAPRTLPLLLGLLNDKRINTKRVDLSLTYLALWSRHYDSGVIEIESEAEVAYDAGYTSTRALRTWHERMALLEQLGFIKSQKLDNRRFALVLLIDPFVAVKALSKQGLVDSGWLATYSARRLKNKEHTQTRAPEEEDAAAPAAHEKGATDKSAARIVVPLKRANKVKAG